MEGFISFYSWMRMKLDQQKQMAEMMEMNILLPFDYLTEMIAFSSSKYFRELEFGAN